MFAALGIGVAALALALLGYTFPGVIAGAAAAWMGGRAWSEAPKDKEGLSPFIFAALGCGGLALAIGFIALVQTAYPD
ncbi:hypothetical protein OJ998_03475 [Solirubrobacter taibaiensis]|nr:hypothetical protein [Solirubrobacter taibaiensis]